MYWSSWHDWVNIGSWISDSQPEGNPANWPPLPLEAIGQSALCSHYLRNEVLDILARWAPGPSNSLRFPPTLLKEKVA